MTNNVNNEELNKAAMQIILHAGDSRNFVNSALNGLENDMEKAEVLDLMKQAKTEITIAHKIQTEMIQTTIENDEFTTTLLFSHAQDTLMTIYSELNIANHLVRIFYKLMQGRN